MSIDLPQSPDDRVLFDGVLWAPAPAELHPSPLTAQKCNCMCARCKAYRKQLRQNRAERRAHNEAVIQRLQEEREFEELLAQEEAELAATAARAPESAADEPDEEPAVDPVPPMSKAKRQRKRLASPLPNPTDVDELRKRLRKLGCSIEFHGRRAKHARVFLPSGRFCTTIANTPSDHRTLTNEVMKLRRQGIDVRRMTLLTNVA